MKYRKKPVVVEAFRFGFHHYPKWFLSGLRTGGIDIVFNGPENCWAVIATLEGEMIAHNGDYIIRGVQGEIYPCKPNIFRMTYEEVSEND